MAREYILHPSASISTGEPSAEDTERQMRQKLGEQGRSLEDPEKLFKTLTQEAIEDPTKAKNLMEAARDVRTIGVVAVKNQLVFPDYNHKQGTGTPKLLRTESLD